MVLRECPYCHRPLEARLLSKEEIDSGEATKVSDFPLEASPVRGITQGGLSPSTATGMAGLVLGLDDSDRSAIALHPEAFITYRMTYRCNHCGKEWTKISVETKPLPREYVVEDEED
jgi:MoaA/NifB/PqqE/SkfB family radical SAM enzyme